MLALATALRFRTPAPPPNITQAQVAQFLGTALNYVERRERELRNTLDAKEQESEAALQSMTAVFQETELSKRKEAESIQDLRDHIASLEA